MMVWVGETPKSCISFGIDTPGTGACNAGAWDVVVDLGMRVYHTKGGRNDD
jgi:hypothetical protein